jgi:outer membrane protein assembly factor BamB
MGTSGNLYCLNEATGSLLWSTTGSGSRAQAYDNGQIFILSLGGTLHAFNAATGASNWSIQLPSQDFTATPTATNGTVYAAGEGGAGLVYAVDEADGSIEWTGTVENGDQSSPAIDSGGVFVSYSCQDYDFSLATGALVWHYDNGCSGGGGKTEAVANGQVFDRENGGIVFSESSGAQVGSFASDRIPALNSTIECFLSSGTLTVKSVASGAVLWTFRGDGSLNSAPLIIDQTVIIGSGTGNVYALNATTGQQIWSGNAGALLPAPDEQNLGQPLTGFAAGEGYLIVTAGSTLTAWHIVGQ